MKSDPPKGTSLLEADGDTGCGFLGVTFLVIATVLYGIWSLIRLFALVLEKM